MTSDMKPSGRGRRVKKGAILYKVEMRTGSGVKTSFSSMAPNRDPFAMRQGRMFVPEIRAVLEWEGRPAKGYLCLEDVEIALTPNDILPGKRVPHHRKSES